MNKTNSLLMLFVFTAGIAVSYLMNSKNTPPRTISDPLSNGMCLSQQENSSLKNFAVKIDGQPIDIQKLSFSDNLRFAKIWGENYKNTNDFLLDIAVRHKIANNLQLEEYAPHREKIWSEVTTNEITKEEIERFKKRHRDKFNQQMTSEAIDAAIENHLENNKKNLYFESQLNGFTRKKIIENGKLNQSCPPKITENMKNFLEDFVGKTDKIHQIVYIANPFCIKCRLIWAEIAQFWKTHPTILDVQVVPINSHLLENSAIIPRIVSCINKTDEIGNIKADSYTHLYTLPIQIKSSEQEATKNWKKHLTEKGWQKKRFETCLDMIDNNLMVEKTNFLLSETKNVKGPIILINGYIFTDYIDENDMFHFLKMNLTSPIPKSEINN